METVAAEVSRRETVVEASRAKEGVEGNMDGHATEPDRTGSTSPLRPLSELPPWTVAIVESVHGARDLRRRLLEMGFCNRTMVTVIRRAPLGDPIEFFLRGYYVSLRTEEARCVLVSPIPPASEEERSNPSGLGLWK